MSTRKKQPPTPSPVSIPPALGPALRMRLALIEQKRIELNALELELRTLLSTVCQVDLVNESWNLDEDHLLLTRIEAASQPQQ